MLDLIKPLKSLANATNISKVCIDNNIFRLHYRFTAIILMVCSALVTSRQYIGDPIKCMSDSDSALEEIMDTYCWIHSTATIAVRDPHTHKFIYKAANEENDSIFPEEAHPGVGPVTKLDRFHYHTYYQWVWCILFFQGLFFYLPHWIWKTCEGGRIKMLVSDLLNAHVMSEETKKERKKIIIEYLSPHKGLHKAYCLQFCACEVLNFVNVIAQMWITNIFLGREFTKYGFDVMAFTQNKPYQRNDPMARVFPTVTSCEISRFGPSGKIVNHDALCVLPINILNEKIYIFLWFWFIVVATISAVAIIYRLLVFLSLSTRIKLIKTNAHSVSIQTATFICKNYEFGDWFLLMQLGRNMTPITFGELIGDIEDNVQCSKKNVSLLSEKLVDA